MNLLALDDKASYTLYCDLKENLHIKYTLISKIGVC